MRTFVSVPKHDFSNHLHTIVLIEELEKNIQAPVNIKQFHHLVEDDYLFKDNALAVARSLEGIYDGFCVLYDYPDRYAHPEATQVVLGLTCHWRRINSCTMTIGACANTWRKYLSQLKSAAPTSNDKVFEEIFKTTPCFSPIPGVASHLTATHHTPYFNVKKRWNELEIL